MENYFAFKDEDYVRQLNPLEDYVKQQVFYLSKMTGKSKEECRDFIKKQLGKGGKFEFKDPTVNYLGKKENGDRERMACKLSKYIETARKHDLILSPSWTIYLPSRIRVSLYTSYIEKKSAVRSAYKKALFFAEQKNNLSDIKFNNGMQSSAKIFINSISGGTMSPGTINHTQSLHPTLTSTCALSTSLANLNNEKLLAGNRPYLTYQFTIDNIIAITSNADYRTLKIAMDKFNVHYPTIDETVECVAYSSDLYWRDDKKMGKIRAFVEKLTDIERAAFVYIGDLYHLYKYNKELVTKFINGLSTRYSYKHDDPEKFMRNHDKDVAILAKVLFKDYLKGTNLDELITDDYEKYKTVVATIAMIESHLNDYADFIKGFLRPSILPQGANSSVIPNMLRRAVLTSDTDSTIFTTQDWIKRIVGSIGFEDEHYNVGNAMTFLVNKTVYHRLAMMSKNMGYELKDLHIISMKNEYYFPVYVLTNQTKNYFAYILVREGHVYNKPKLEKKGVAIRSSKIPSNVMDKFDEYIKHLMDTIMTNLHLTREDVFINPFETEMAVKESIQEGYAQYFQTQQIKDANSYKQGYDAPALKQHRFWNEVFAPKYGESPEIPYVALKVSTKLSSKRKIKEWLDSLEDKALVKRIENYMKNEDRSDLTTIYVPKLTVGSGTIPKEIVGIIDINKQLLNVTSPYYLTLESLGFYLRNPKNTTMINDVYRPLLEQAS